MEKSTTPLAYSVKEVSEITSFGRTTLYKLMGDGRLPSTKVAGRRLIRHEDVLALIEGRASRASGNAEDDPSAAPSK